MIQLVTSRLRRSAKMVCEKMCSSIGVLLVLLFPYSLLVFPQFQRDQTMQQTQSVTISPTHKLIECEWRKLPLKLVQTACTTLQHVMTERFEGLARHDASSVSYFSRTASFLFHRSRRSVRAVSRQPRAVTDQVPAAPLLVVSIWAHHLTSSPYM
jgi:hypothetical protein